MRSGLLGALVLGGLLGVVVPAGAQKDEKWGTIQGTLVWGEKAMPKREPIDLKVDKAHCLSRGPQLDMRYLVDPRTKGVRDVMVWLIPANKGNAPLPIHPSLAKPADEVILDQPCCQFEPMVMGMREGQTLLAKNSSPVPHNTNIIGGKVGVNLNPLIPPGGAIPVKGWKAAPSPASVSCSIHPWMKAYIRVFDHPYFAVTDKDGKFEMKNAPAGKYRLVVWHPESGWVTGDGKEPDRYGRIIEIKGGTATKLPAVSVKYPAD